jgi:hypothetical protein
LTIWGNELCESRVEDEFNRERSETHERKSGFGVFLLIFALLSVGRSWGERRKRSKRGEKSLIFASLASFAVNFNP